MPNTGSRISHFVTHKPNPVVAWVGFDLADCCASPGHDGWLHPDRRANACKIEIGWASANIKPTIGGIVEHVALPGMRLAPRVLVRSNILRFGEVGRAGILRRVQVGRCDCDPVRRASVVVTIVIVSARWERASKGIHPRA
jgi:hypothetical protein